MGATTRLARLFQTLSVIFRSAFYSSLVDIWLRDTFLVATSLFIDRFIVDTSLDLHLLFIIAHLLLLRASISLVFTFALFSLSFKLYTAHSLRHITPPLLFMHPSTTQPIFRSIFAPSTYSDIQSIQHYHYTSPSE